MFWRKKQNEVKFTSTFGPVPHEPAPAARFMPEWFKKQRSYYGEESKTHVWIKDTVKPSYTPTVKRCIPFRDMLTSGYIIPFPYDIGVKCIIDENTGEPVVGIHTAHQSYGGAAPIGFHSRSQISNHPYWEEKWAPDKAYKFVNPWIISTPPGVSCMILHPQHHDITKWEILSAVVDTDCYQSNILFPALFKVKPGDEFIIEGGTPMAQIIPFKRDKWNHQVSHHLSLEESTEFAKADGKVSGTLGVNRYKKWFWKRKVYK